MDKVTALKKAGQVAVAAHNQIKKAAVVGANLLDLEEIARSVIADAGLKPAFLGYKDYPHVTCLAVNDEIVHAIPKDYDLMDGDVLTVDLGVACDGWIVDTARTHLIGHATSEAQNLVAATQLALDQALSVCTAGKKVGDIGYQVEKTIKEHGLFVIKDLNGHGVGKTLQEPPLIPNFGKPNTGALLKEGMVLAIEPIIATKPTTIAVLEDDWTIVAGNGALCAQIEDTIIITNSNPIILTR